MTSPAHDRTWHTMHTVHDIGHIDDYVPGTPYRVEAEGRVMVVVRKGSEFYALRDVCPHKGAEFSQGQVTGTTLESSVGECEIPYGRVGTILRCPWHGWEFDLTTGRSLVDPEKIRVRAYPVRVKGDRVLVDLD